MINKKNRYRPLQAFISHSSNDAKFVLDLQERLNNETKLAKWASNWAFEKNLPYGKDIDTAVLESISECDLFVLIDSPAARVSAWVQRELGLACSLRNQRVDGSPRIRVIRLKGDYNRLIRMKFAVMRVLQWLIHIVMFKQTTSSQFLLRDFSTGKVNGFFTFSERMFCVANPHTDRFDTLVEELTPNPEFFGSSTGDIEVMPDGWDRCYEALFPDLTSAMTR
jgi:hypothetical protein